MNSKTLIRSLGTMRAAAARAGLWALAGCAESHLSTPSLSPAPGEYRQSMNAYVWGLVLDPQVVAAEDCKYGIDDVFIERNFGQDLASVVTLGLWMPAGVGYHCRAQGTRGRSIPQ